MTVPKAIIYIAADGVSDASVVNETDLEVRVTAPGSAVEAVIVVPVDQAPMWAADVYAAVTIAYRNHTADAAALTDWDLAMLPDPGRIIFEQRPRPGPPTS